MSAARHVKAVTAGIAECVTEDHLPIRWNHGTRPAKYWHWRAIRRCNPFPSLSRTTTTYCYFNYNYNCYCWYGTANYLLRLRKLLTTTSTSDYNCELQQVLPSVKPGTLSDHWLQQL
jgi:hypothetical protein